jgi:prepilin-type N-terminal cleavage/methylation domain-containing protein
MKIRNSRGFTLIELLVVIAIIGILSSVVLASLNAARGKGANAAIKSNLANMRAQAAIYYDGTGAGTYGATANLACAGPGSMFLDAVITNAIAAITVANAAPQCNGAAGGWAMSAQLKVAEGTNTYWCVDSTGASKGTGAALASGILVC